MAVTGICARLRAWGELYPDPSAPAGQNAAARAHEDERLAKFAGRDVLDRDQVIQRPPGGSSTNDLVAAVGALIVRLGRPALPI